ncbi:DUF6482 family protein [Saccharospirillum impatiens]|uniref:DUF6482 family protein n=1 Tax=Saccharospirillum impatiens TaxID=169438 RepID=UPI00041E5B32|nr:DUF6482 family protein [Saccharospirillum impatiens]
MSLTLKQARHHNARFNRAEVEALMGTFYQIHLFDNKRGHLLVDEEGRPVQVKSLPGVRVLLNQLPLDQAELVHRSAFGEMIGLDEADNTLRVPIRLTHPDEPESAQ